MNKSYLMVAGDKEKQLRKIPELLCDVAMINLEDGVYDKEYAKNLIKRVYEEFDLNSKKKIVIRVNSIEEGGLEEIEDLKVLNPYAFRVAKIKTLKDVEKIIHLFRKYDIKSELHLSIETKEIFQNIVKLESYEEVTTLYLGILDLLESLSLPQNILDINNPTIEYILSKFLVESKMVSKNPVGFIYQEYKNIDIYEKWCTKLKSMGYISASCLSPSQVTIANRVFSSDEEVITRAHHIKEVFEKNKAQGITGFSDEKYGFIDEPIYKDALLVLKAQ